LGLSRYEAKVYVSLVEAGIANARTLSMISGVPRTKVYSVLRKLIDAGLVIEVPEEPKKFTPTPPKTAFESYLRSYRSMAESFLSVVSSLDEAFKKARSGKNLRKGIIWIINGQRDILRKIREMLSRAKSSVDLVTDENALILLYRSFNKLLDELAERSIEVRVLTPFTPSSRHIVNELKYVCKVEKFDFELPLILLCVDRKKFLLADLQRDDSSSEIMPKKCIFSDNQVLYELINLLALKKTNMYHLQPLINASDRTTQQ
jgi:sugar-specific transcriptional regulator TrmB